MRRLVLSLVAVVLALSLGVPADAAARGPRLGSSQRVINAVWRRDGTPCIGGICSYYVPYLHPLWIHVLYGKKGAESFDVAFDPNHASGNGPSPAGGVYWRFLTALLPSGAKRTGCRYIAKTGGLQGPANACLYRTRLGSALVAQYLTATGSLSVGTVALHEGYDSVEAAQ